MKILGWKVNIVKGAIGIVKNDGLLQDIIYIGVSRRGFKVCRWTQGSI